MNTYVSVSVSDNLISVNDSIVVFSSPIKVLAKHAGMATLLWFNTYGKITFSNDYIRELTESDFENDVKPYIDMYDVEYNSEDKRFERLRAKRNALMAETDYIAMSDYPAEELTEECKTALLKYRQELRDITSKPGAPWEGDGSVPWPEKPAIVKA